MLVEFAVGVDEPPMKGHSVYTDLVNLPDPVELGLTVRIFNYDDVTLYMKVDGYKAGWTFTENNLGSVASGASTYDNLDDFGTRARPASETVDSVTVRLRAYTDSGYSNLKWTYERSVSMVFLKTDDGSWTTDVSNNFDDGTVQGWAATGIIDVATDYVLSVPYSCRMDVKINKITLYIGGQYYQGLHIREDSQDIIRLGKGHVAASVNYLPQDKWMRLVLPLTPASTFELGIVTDWTVRAGSFWSHAISGRLYKSLTTPSASEVFAIINVRARSWREQITPGNNWHHCIIQLDNFRVIYR